MSKNPKYKAKYVFWDSLNRCVIAVAKAEEYRVNGRLKLPKHIYRFDSQHEFKVYLELVRIYGVSRVQRQYRLLVIPPCSCYPQGKYWKVDFVIRRNEPFMGISHFVEAKGIFLPEFICTLTHLEREDQDVFARTRIVFGSSIPKESKVVRSLLKTNFAKNLLTLKELKHLDKLP